MKRIALIDSVWFWLLFLVATSCGHVEEKDAKVHAQQEKATAYNFTNPEIIQLPAKLNEISGISYSEKDNAVYAVHDESGNIYKLSLQKDPKVDEWPLSKKGDYEELLIHDNRMYILESGGSILSFPLMFPVGKIEEAKMEIAGKNEFEIMFKDPAANRLLLMCKECKGDGKGEVSVLAFNLQTKSFESGAVSVLKRKDIENVLKEDVERFKPSGAAVHPQTGELYIVSSVNKLLVITDASFAVKQVHKLDPKLFKQPEGLAFTTSGDLLVSNEAAETGSPNILIFRQAK